MNPQPKDRIAWLFPSLERGNYWHPVFKEFSRIIEDTVIFTGLWPGYAAGYEDSFKVKIVGKTRFVDYTTSVSYVSPAIIGQLLKFKPNLIFSSGFSIWTLISLVLKPIGKWQVVIVYDGSSPSVDFRESKTRLLARRFMAKVADAFITNSHAGKTYLTEIIGSRPDKVFARPYQVPTQKALSKSSSTDKLDYLPAKRPVFLFVGQLIERKGLENLLKACSILQRKKCINYTLLIAGDGPQRQDLEAMSREYDLEDQLKWLGWINYADLGSYFQTSDVFVLPTLEDVWGMVVLEAMLFSKPILCSKLAGVSEIVEHGINGYVFDPTNYEELALLMECLINQPDLIAKMGDESKRVIDKHTLEAVVRHLADVTSQVLRS
ncbi:MAG TPA: glycosyltransferase family 4 protein [Phormidium sp.]